MASLAVPIPKEFVVVVKRGDRLERGSLLARAKPAAGSVIALHELLHIKPDKLDRYLVKEDGEEVVKGEIIARKKSLLTTVEVKSPVDGVFTIAKDTPGSVYIRKHRQDSITSPTEGDVRKANEEEIILQVDTTVFRGTQGDGICEGDLIKIENGHRIFTIDRSVAGKIVFGSNLESSSVAKIKTLGGKGVIVERDDLVIKEIPHIVLENVGDLDKYTGRTAEIYNDGNGHYVIVRSG